MLDRKENILERLQDEYKIAEDQCERSVTAHINLLSQFTGKFFHILPLVSYSHSSDHDLCYVSQLFTRDSLNRFKRVTKTKSTR